MDERREQLRISWADVARKMDMTEENLLRIRKGRIGISLKAAKKIEGALLWPPGSVEDAVVRDTRPLMPADSSARPEIDPSAGTPDDLRRELSHFHSRFRESPEDYARLLDLLKLYAHLQRGSGATQGGLQADAQG